MQPISLEVKCFRWRWKGCVCRMPPTSILRVAIRRTPGGKRACGRPKEVWRQSVEQREMKTPEQSWGQVMESAENIDVIWLWLYVWIMIPHIKLTSSGSLDLDTTNLRQRRSGIAQSKWYQVRMNSVMKKDWENRDHLPSNTAGGREKIYEPSVWLYDSEWHRQNKPKYVFRVATGSTTRGQSQKMVKLHARLGIKSKCVHPMNSQWLELNSSLCGGHLRLDKFWHEEKCRLLCTNLTTMAVLKQDHPISQLVWF